MTGSKVPGWVPDWRDAAAYTRSFTNERSTLAGQIVTDLPTEDWPLPVWIWEFLRRNKEYQADYERFVALPGYHKHGGKTSKWSGRPFEGDMSMWYFDPPALPSETRDQYFLRHDDIDSVCMPLEAHLRTKWCITNVPDPAKDDGYFILGPEIETPPYWLQIEGADATGYIPPISDPDEIHHVTLRFDLRYSIDKQLERAKEYIELQQEHLRETGGEIDLIRATGPQLHKLPYYLRAFDADCAGATLSEIGEILFPEKRHELRLESMIQSAHRAVKGGNELVYGGYKELIRFK
jgi:hypothetical protein